MQVKRPIDENQLKMLSQESQKLDTNQMQYIYTDRYRILELHCSIFAPNQRKALSIDIVHYMSQPIVSPYLISKRRFPKLFIKSVLLENSA